MILLSDLLKQDAVSLRTATKTGSVKGITLDGDQIISVELSDSTIPASAVRSFEGDVLTYDDADEIDSSIEAGTGRDPRGSRVLDVGGDSLGTIADLAITASGTVDHIVLADGQTIVGGRLRAIGSYAAIIGLELPPPTGQPLG